MSARKRIGTDKFSPRLRGARESSRICKPFLGTWVTGAAYKGLVLFLATLAALAPISHPSLAAGDAISHPAPAAGDAFSIVSAGRTHTMAIKTDGSLWAWGSYGYGKLGNGIDVHPFIVNPIPDKVMDGVTSVSAGDTHTIAIKADGSLWACGYNGNGQLGDGTTNKRPLFVKILDGAASVSAGSTHTLAIKTDGSLWAWGDNQYGQLGDGTATNRKKPVEVMDAVASVSAGAVHTMAITEDGSLWAWGANNNGVFGNGTQVYSFMPTKITPVEIKVFLDGEQLAFDVPPRIIMGSTLVPLRAIFEVMGAFVEWDDATQTVTATKDDKVVVLTIGRSSATVNGQTVQIGQPGITAGGRTLAPLRFVAEAFGETVTWDRDTLTAAITS